MKEYVAFCLVGLGVLLCLIALVMLVICRRHMRRSQEVRAKVVENVRRRDSHGQALYFPMLEFEWQGQTKRLDSELCTPWEQYHPMEQVSALYDPAKDRLVLKARPGPWAMAVALLVLGVLLVLGGSVLLLRTMLW